MIIKSLLDLDLYKLTMMQLAWKNFGDVKIRTQFHNRTDIDLSKFITTNKLRKEFNEIRKLRFSSKEISYLEGLNLFEKDFLTYLKNYQLPEITIEDSFNIYSDGLWKDVILWETLVLSTINQLYYESKYSVKERNESLESGLDTLNKKLSLLTKSGIKGLITDFGTRRRFSSDWQDKVISIIKNHPSFGGTSNVYLAMKYNWTPIGTNAHELYMVSAGYYGETDDGLKSSHSYIMNQWYHMYGYDLSIGLTDTFGTDFFFEDFKDKASKWKGMRHDSGNPFIFGEKCIDYYKSLDIDPITKLLVFSDGLSVDKIIDLYDIFNDQVKLAYGWGTKLTNDLGFETLSIVMKSVFIFSERDKTMNRSLVKLSDNTNKHVGETDEVERYKRVFDYSNTDSEKLVV